jgi:hypothetical protein
MDLLQTPLKNYFYDANRKMKDNKLIRNIKVRYHQFKQIYNTSWSSGVQWLEMERSLLCQIGLVLFPAKAGFVMNVDEFVIGKKPVNPLLANPRSRVIPENVASSSQKKTFKTFKMYLSKSEYRQHDALNSGFVNTKEMFDNPSFSFT